jgi:DNA polymerase-3 subunit epsilon
MKVFWTDLETSGMDHSRHGIIQLAYEVEIDGQMVASGEMWSNCEGKEIEDSALRVNGFTREQIATFGSPRQMYLDLDSLFAQFVDKFDRDDKFYAGGYNATSFDMGFLRQLWTDCGDSYFGSWFYYGALDPGPLWVALKYAGVDLPYATSSKLVDVAVALGIDVLRAHNAQADLRLTRDVMAALIQRMRNLR